MHRLKSAPIAAVVIATMTGGVGLATPRPAQERFLATHGCDELQGFRFGRPVAAEEIENLFSRSRERGSTVSAANGPDRERRRR